jgi:hypothetical protein
MRCSLLLSPYLPPYRLTYRLAPQQFEILRSLSPVPHRVVETHKILEVLRPQSSMIPVLRLGQRAPAREQQSFRLGPIPERRETDSEGPLRLGSAAIVWPQFWLVQLLERCASRLGVGFRLGNEGSGGERCERSGRSPLWASALRVTHLLSCMHKQGLP